MLYRKEGQWALAPFKVRYTENGIEKEQFISDKQWWLDLESKWEHIQIIEIIDADWTNEEKARLEEIKDVPEGFGDVLEEYVKTGQFPEGNNHVLRNLQLEKENERLKEELTSQQSAINFLLGV